MSYTETVNPRTVDLMKGDYRKDIKSKCEDTYKERKNDLKSEYDKRNEAKKKDEKKLNNQEKKTDKKERSRDRKNDEKKERDKKDKTDRKIKERKPSENRKDKENKKSNDHKTEGKRDKKQEEKKSDKTDEESKNIKPSQNMQVSVTKALEQFNVNPVALLVSKMIDQQSLVVKLLTEAREKDMRKFDFSERGERADEICRMREKVRILERQLKTLELSLEGKADKFDAITKTESTQTQQYGIDNATNTHLDEKGDTKEVTARLNALRQRHTCNII